ncbi:hypothetical protein [Gilvimarinus chinensis]|uniref:hypothetical protein n=1 Tax=Gilvimarinus chinensis TaxID=396005 RepID=UPI00035EB28C
MKAVIGHNLYGLHKAFPSDAQYITVIRHPLSGIISRYNYVKSNRHHYLHDKKNQQAPTLERYVEALRAKELNNGILRAFLGEDYAKKPFYQRHRSMIDTALKHVEKRFVSIVIQEHFDESVERFCAMNEWQHLKLYRRTKQDRFLYNTR